MSRSGIDFGFRLPEEVQGWEPSVEHLVNAGFTWVEVLCPPQPDTKVRKELSRLLAQCGLRCSVHGRFYGINLSSPERRMREAAFGYALEDLEFAAEVSACTIVFHAGEMYWYDFPPREHPCSSEFYPAIERLRRDHLLCARDAVARIVEEAKGSGVQIAVENLYAYWELLRTPDEISEFLNDVGADSGIGCAVDVGHAQVAGYGAADFCTRLGDRIKHTHIHVNDGQFDCHWTPNRAPERVRGWVAALARLKEVPPLVIEAPTRSVQDHVESLNLLQEVVAASYERQCDVGGK